MTSRNPSIPRIVLGLVLVTVGLLISLDRMDVVRIDHAGGLWPVALIGVGAAKLWQGWNTAEAAAGTWLVLARSRSRTPATPTARPGAAPASAWRT